MIRLIGCGLIIAASSMAGFIFAEDLKRRAEQLRDIQNAVLQLQNEIFYSHTTLPEAFKRISEKCREPASSLFNFIAIKLLNNEVDNVNEAFRLAIENLDKNIKLNKLDVSILMDLARGLGEGDIEGHKKIFILVDENLRKSIEDADCQINKNVKLYRYLGFSFGAVVAILLI